MKKKLGILLVAATTAFAIAPLFTLAGGSFFIDDTTSYVGIGNTTPAARLDVSGAMYSRLVTATSSAIAWGQGNVQSLTLTSNSTLAFSGGQAGGVYDLIVTQDSTGGRTITWPGSVKWLGAGEAPTLTSTANALNIVHFIYDGTNYLGAASEEAVAAPMLPSQYANFVATSSQVLSAAATTSLAITGDLTAEMWVKFDSLPSTNAAVSLASKKNLTGDQRAWHFYLKNDSGTNNLHFSNSSDGTAGSQTDVEVAWTPSIDTWYHVAVVYTSSSGSAKFYVNDILQGTEQTGLNSSTYNSTAPLSLGAGDFDGSNYTNFLTGHISLARIWDTTRTANQLATDKCNLLGSTSNLKAEWSLQNTLNDNSGNNNTLTNGNSVTFTVDDASVCHN